MANRKYFGTDGVRGKVGTYPITPDFALKLGWAAGKVLASQGSRTVLIGKDTRISGYMLESALEAGLAAAGLTAAFTGPMPTPAVAYLTRTFRLEAGIVISASHNPIMIMELNSSLHKAQNYQMILKKRLKPCLISQWIVWSLLI